MHMEDKLYERFKNRWKETTELRPQTVGPLTSLYKTATQRLKAMPMPTLFIISTILVLLLIWYIGPSIVSYVSILQRGF